MVRRPPKGIQSSWFISYVTILLVPLLITVVLFWGVEQRTAEKIGSMNQATLEHMRRTVDTALDGTRSVMLQVEISQEVAAALRIGAEPTAQDHYTMLQLVRRLREYRDVGDFISDLLLYLPGPGYFITAQTTYSPPIAGDMLQREQRLTQADIQALSEIDMRGFTVLPGGPQPAGRLVYAAPLKPAGRPAGLLIAVLDDGLFDALAGGSSADRAVFLSDRGNAIALGPLPGWLPASYPQLLQSEDVGVVRKLEGQRLIASGLLSEIIPGQYIILENYDTLYRELQTIRSWVIAALALCALLGLGLSFYFLDRNYSPLRRLVASITGGTGLKRQKHTDEYSFLHEAMRDTIVARQTAERALSSSEPFLQKLYIIELLRGGNVDGMRPADLSGTLGVVLYQVEDTRGFFGVDAMLTEDRDSMLHFLLDNLSHDLFDGLATFHLLNMDRYFVQVLRYGDAGARDLRAQTLQRLETMHRTLSGALEIKLSIALGDLCTGPMQLAAAYVSAQEAMEYRMVLGDNVLIDAADRAEFSLFYDYSIELERAIIDSLKSGNHAGTMRLINRVIDDNLSSGMLSAKLARCMFFDLIGTVIKALSGTQLQSSFLVRLDPIDRLLRLETLPQMKEALSDIIRSVCDYIVQEKPDAQLFDAIHRHLDGAYADPDLNVAELAARFSISTTSLAKVFKENAGMTPLDYINRLRIERSLHALIATSMTVEAIAGSVGYGNAHTFIRVFKKIHGMTPGTYRELYAAPAQALDIHQTTEDTDHETL